MTTIVWYTDTHLLPWNRYKMLNSILDAKPDAVFLTGDVSHTGYTFISDLEFLAKRIGRPLYFVPGNHDYFGSSIPIVNSKIRELCTKYKDLVWMDEANTITLKDGEDSIACIGHTGWYDSKEGNRDYIKYTFDWRFIKDFRDIKSWEERFAAFEKMSADSTRILVEKLERALETHKRVFLLTHFPPFASATRCNSLFSEKFWASYNTNKTLGNALERVMEKHKKRNLTVFCGHSHSETTVFISRNIECKVGRGNYLKLSDDYVFHI